MGWTCLVGWSYVCLTQALRCVHNCTCPVVAQTFLPSLIFPNCLLNYCLGMLAVRLLQETFSFKHGKNFLYHFKTISLAEKKSFWSGDLRCCVHLLWILACFKSRMRPSHLSWDSLASALIPSCRKEPWLNLRSERWRAVLCYVSP